MKLLRTILIILASLLLIPCAYIATAGAAWFTLSDLALTKLGIFITNILSNTQIFWITIGCAIAFILLCILKTIFGKQMPAKAKNITTYITAWGMCLIGISSAVYTFACSNPLIANEVLISPTRKISIAVTIGLLILFHLFSGKIGVIINRRIQAYETAKESNIVGRGNVILINFLKFIEVIFPELLILLLLCFCVSWNVASYFITIIVSAFIPVIGNIIADFNTRMEIRRINLEKEDELARKVADSIRGDM